jgi:hypothetical protein
MKKRFKAYAVFLFSKELKNLEILAIFVLLAWGYCTNLLFLELQPDETYWIATSVRFDKFLTGDFNAPIWSADLYTSYEVRPISSYLVAIGQRLGGIEQTNLPSYWDWELSDEDNISRGAWPSDTVLWWSRLPMAILSAFSITAIAFMLARAHSRAAAYIFIVVSFNTYFLAQLRRALSEPPQILFTVLTLYASYKLLIVAQEKSVKQIVLWSTAVGVFSGLAGQSKLTGLACAGIAILGTVIMMFDPTKSANLARRRIPLVIAVVVSSTLLLTFIISYPFFYENTIDRILTTFAIRSNILQYQIQRYAYQMIPEGARLEILFQRIFTYPLELHVNGAGTVLFRWINFVLTALGIYYCIEQIKQRRNDSEYFVVFLAGAFLCALPMLLTPLDWERYYLYPIFFSCIFFSLGMGELLYLGASYAQRQQNQELRNSESVEI